MAEKVKKQANPAVIQAVKAVAVLVIICLVCGVLLALCNDLLYIDDDTRLERAMQKVYPSFKLKEELTVEKVDISSGKVNRVLLSTDGTYVIEALGEGGWDNGTVTLYVVIGSNHKIKAWTVKEHKGQSFIDRLPSNAGRTWYVGDDASEDQSLNVVSTGATLTTTPTAINNAINAATKYYRVAILGNDTEGEAKAAVLALLSEHNYNCSDVTALDSVKNFIGTALDGENDKLSYIFVGVDDQQGKIYAYVYATEEQFKIVVVTEKEVLVSNCDDTADFYALILAKPIREISVTSTIKLYTFMQGSETQGTSAVYTVVGFKGSGYTPGNYTLTITISNGEVTDIVITVDGWEDHDEFATRERANKLANELKGATLQNFDSKYESGIVANASQSGHIIAAAVKAALAHFDANVASNG